MEIAAFRTLYLTELQEARSVEEQLVAISQNDPGRERESLEVALNEHLTETRSHLDSASPTPSIDAEMRCTPSCWCSPGTSPKARSKTSSRSSRGRCRSSFPFRSTETLGMTSPVLTERRARPAADSGAAASATPPTS